MLNIWILIIYIYTSGYCSFFYKKKKEAKYTSLCEPYGWFECFDFKFQSDTIFYFLFFFML
jgi:hypothetical protein